MARVAMPGKFCTIDRTNSGFDPTGTTNCTDFTLIYVRIRFTGGLDGFLWYTVGNRTSVQALSVGSTSVSGLYRIILRG